MRFRGQCQKREKRARRCQKRASQEGPSRWSRSCGSSCSPSARQEAGVWKLFLRSIIYMYTYTDIYIYIQYTHIPVDLVQFGTKITKYLHFFSWSSLLPHVTLSNETNLWVTCSSPHLWWCCREASSLTTQLDKHQILAALRLLCCLWQTCQTNT